MIMQNYIDWNWQNCSLRFVQENSKFKIIKRKFWWCSKKEQRLQIYLLEFANRWSYIREDMSYQYLLVNLISCLQAIPFSLFCFPMVQLFAFYLSVLVSFRCWAIFLDLSNSSFCLNTQSLTGSLSMYYLLVFLIAQNTIVDTSGWLFSRFY